MTVKKTMTMIFLLAISSFSIAHAMEMSQTEEQIKNRSNVVVSKENLEDIDEMIEAIGKKVNLVEEPQIFDNMSYDRIADQEWTEISIPQDSPSERMDELDFFDFSYSPQNQSMFSSSNQNLDLDFISPVFDHYQSGFYQNLMIENEFPWLNQIESSSRNVEISYPSDYQYTIPYIRIDEPYDQIIPLPKSNAPTTRISHQHVVYQAEKEIKKDPINKQLLYVKEEARHDQNETARVHKKKEDLSNTYHEDYKNTEVSSTSSLDMPVLPEQKLDDIQNQPYPWASMFVLSGWLIILGLQII